MGLGVGGLTFNTQEPHYWSRYSPHTMTIRKWWAEIRTWSRQYYEVNVRVYSLYLIAYCKAYGLAHCWREGLFTTKGKTFCENKRKFRTIKVQLYCALHACIRGVGRDPALTSAADWHEWSASGHGHITPGKTAPRINPAGHCVGPRAYLDALEQIRNLLPILGIETPFIDCAIRSLHRLIYKN